MHDAYRALQGRVLMLIAGAIALGAAMEKTGTARLYAEIFLDLLQGAPPGVILAGVIALTSVSTQILSNNATAMLLFPIAVSVARELGVDPRPFIIGVCIGAGACFATPIGYQTNLLVYAPGGYRASDYLKLGVPLNLMVLVMGSLLISWIWPFYTCNGHNLRFFSTAKRQEPGDRNQAVKRQTPAATRPAPCAMCHQAPRRRAQPPCFEITNGDRCKFKAWPLPRRPGDWGCASSRYLLVYTIGRRIFPIRQVRLETRKKYPAPVHRFSR